MGGYVLYMQLLLKKSSKTNLIFFQARKSEFRHLIYFVNIYKNHFAGGIFKYRRYVYITKYTDVNKNASSNMLHYLVNEYRARKTAIITSNTGVHSLSMFVLYNFLYFSHAVLPIRGSSNKTQTILGRFVSSIL